MLTMFRSEWLKIRRSLFFRILLLLFALCIASYYYMIHSKTVHSDTILANLEMDLESSHAFNDDLQKQQVQTNLDPGLQQVLNQQLKYFPLTELQYVGVKTKNWSMYAKAYKEKLDSPNKEYWDRTYPSRFSTETFMATLTWLENKNIQPVWPLYSWITVYDEIFSDEESEQVFRKSFEQRYSSSGSYFNYHIFSSIYNILGVIFFLFLFSDVVTKEGEGRNGPIYLLRTLPIRKFTITPTKFTLIFFVSIGILVGASSFGIILGSIFDRFGDWNYPILIYGENYSFQIIPLSLFLLKSTALFLLVLAFSYSLLFFFSFLTRRAILALGLTTAILLIGVNLAKQFLSFGYTHYIPFHYYHVFEVVSGTFAAVQKNYSISFENGLLSLATATILVWGMTYTLTFLRSRMER